MTLTLRAVSLNDRPLSQPITGHFDVQGGTIGRADDNTLALPDPERYISRQQAEIVAVKNGYVIRNVGGANPIIVRNKALAQGESAPLIHNDHVRIGGYLLEVIDDSRVDTDATKITRGRGTEGKPDTRSGLRDAPVTPIGLGDLGGALSSNNPFAELLGTPVPAPTHTPHHTPTPVPTPAPAFARARTPATSYAAQADDTPRHPSTPVRLPDDFDPFAPPAQPRAATPALPTANSPVAPGAGLFDDLIPSTPSASLDDVFNLKSGLGDDPLASFLTGGALSGPAPETPARPFPGGYTPDHTPELHSAFTPPKVVRPPAAPAAHSDALDDELPTAPVPLAGEPAPRPAEAAPGVSLADGVARAPEGPTIDGADESLGAEGDEGTEALWAAFCEGAGIRLQPPQGLNPELMRIVGKLLRSSVAGMLQLIAVRSATRHELRAQVTIIRPRENNPLKFSPDAQSALEQLLQPPLRGFLPGPAAMSDAMNDLVGHSIGTMAGTRAALEGVLGRFAPAELEAKLAGKSMLDSVLPMNRKAKLWELYLQHYDAIRDEAQEDFHTLFGKAFLAAYEQQLERLRRDKSSAPH